MFWAGRYAPGLICDEITQGRKIHVPQFVIEHELRPGKALKVRQPFRPRLNDYVAVHGEIVILIKFVILVTMRLQRN